MNRSIIAKLWITIVLLIVAVLLALGIGLFQAVEKYYYKQIENNFISQGREVIELYIEDPAKFEENNEIDHASRMMKAHAMILNDKGIIQICDTMMNMSSGSFFEETELTRIFSGKIIAKRGYHQNFNLQMLTIGLPIIKNNAVENALLIYTPIAPLSSVLKSFQAIIYWGLLIAVILSSILAFFLSRTLSRPLIRMNQIALSLSDGDYSQRVNVKNSDEIGVLGNSLNFLSQKLKKNITELSYEKEKIENILLSISDGVITFDRTGKIILLNPQAKCLLEYCEDVEKDKSLEHCQYLSQLNSLYMHVMEKEELIEGEIYIKAKILLVKLSPLFDRSSKDIIGVVTVLQDVTKERKLEEMRRDFVTNVSHELRTPISLIQGYSEALIDDVYESPEQQNSFLKVILLEANRLKRLVNDLLELSRLQSDVIDLEKEWINIAQLINEVNVKFQTSLLQNNIDFEMAIDTKAESIFADRFKLEQVLINLISNAIRYSFDGKIIVTTQKRENGVELRISDTGEGIPEDDLPLIFERLYRSDKSRNRESGGTGIGLSIVKNIIDAHNGMIHVKSILGEGTTFTILFPSMK
ncbi:MAG: hypothetical protein APF84_01690 [Gracilibacter sp. BRH_c7a]|nr:MAG: hypothetical protein APF84_01690 [Gracilibacter sp. BRH_c7a]